MPIRDHPEAFSKDPCGSLRYGVLVGVSTGYPPVAGRLHTRYAPVRRSPAAHCCAPLPLDLHVLGLPLAFILSQDQTLHCKNCLLLPFDSSSCLRTRPRPDASDTRYLIFPIRFNVLSLSLSRNALAVRFPVESGCKDTTFFQTAKFFFRFFFVIFHTPLCHSRLYSKLFFIHAPKAAENPLQNAPDSPVFPENRPPSARIFPEIPATCWFPFV